MKKSVTITLTTLPLILLLGITMTGMRLGNNVTEETPKVIDHSTPPEQERIFVEYTTHYTERVGNAEFMIPETQKLPLPKLKKPEEK